MTYEEFAAEYRRLFKLMVANPYAEGGSFAAGAMADLADKVPAEWVDKVESKEGNKTLFFFKSGQTIVISKLKKNLQKSRPRQSAEFFIFICTRKREVW
jgi:hypothetical protein